MRPWQWLAALALLCSGPAAQAATLLWLTTDLTPPARGALVERLAAQAGMAVQRLELPLRGLPEQEVAEHAAVDRALAGAAMVWIDAPHASALGRLRTLLAPALPAFEARASTPVWIAGAAAGVVPADLASRMGAYLHAGGERNVRHAVTLAAAAMAGRPLPELPPPHTWPLRGVHHPAAPTLFADAAQFARWQAEQPALRDRPAVALLVHRYHFVDGETGWIDAWLRAFEQAGLVAYAAFGQRPDAPALAALLEVDGRLHARVLVTHQLLPQGAALQPLFERWGAPVLATLPYRAGGTQPWERDDTGLAQTDVPFYLAQPEAAGTIDPVLVVAHADGGRRPELVERQAAAVVAKVRRLVALQTTPAADKRLVAMVYNYPAGASNFGASFLNVPRSLEQLSRGLAEAGYRTAPLAEDQWIARLKPLLAAYYDGADPKALLASGQAAALPLARYEAWWAALPAAVRARIEGRWGPPSRSRYVVLHEGEPVFVIPRLQLGQLAVLPQPPREETLYRGKNPFTHKSRVPLSHHYLATYLWARQADALIHFGTHGTQEWAPGKARALDVLDDALLPLGDLPVVYPYIVDNLGEALTAKRRGRGLLVSHRTPTLAPAGFAARMADMHELMHEWETVDAGPTRRALERRLIEQFVEHQLHRDLGWSRDRIAADFTGFLEQLHPWLDQMAQSSQPQGLAVFGRVPAPEQRRQTILQALRKPLIQALGEDIDEAFLIDHRAVAASRPARWLDVALRDAQAASVLDLRPPQPEGPVPNRAARQPIDTAALLQLAQRAQLLEARLATEGEMPGLLAALAGRFVPAAYGGDPIRNPDSLPTGRNLAGLDASRLPTRQAYAVAQTLFDDWLKSWRATHGGRAPSRLVLSLWAGETLRHQGVMEAQALVALGVAPVWDDAGRPSGLRVIPAAQLQRPRVDVLLSVTGSYRDQFPALMALLDRAAAAAAAAEPGNAVARNTADIAAELAARGVPQAQALARARVFGNATGDYGTGIADAVQADGLRTADTRLGELFLRRMSQPYVDGQALAGVPAPAAEQALRAQLRRSDAALLSRSSHLYAMVSSDDPFQYLGGLAAAARHAGKAEPLALYVSQLQDADEPATDTAARAVALELQSRYLHPGWLRAQQAEGYAGTLQVLKAVQFTWGWQAVAPDTVRSDHWQSFHDLLVRDKHALGVPQWLRSHPQAYAQALERLVQAQRLGHWRPDGTTRKELATLYRELTREAARSTELASVRRWVDGTLAAPKPRAPRQQPMALVAPVVVEPLRGVRLQRQPDPPDMKDAAALMSQALAALLMALPVVGGAAWQNRRAGSRTRSPVKTQDT
ncbi:cobaltochelatase subunit CobN [Piscinibacter sp.]|uniref:cobaltochelatase subunit CobN n=1 Tax=Piscinibacter sp. TaxID=1903157 RepID=UPI002C3AB5C2|nr:cobaltochelatase subunit CobN [Albitalea sp.]HUG25478.1 cobaltochelatase subunit CobN [Albitalea sp.]